MIQVRSEKTFILKTAFRTVNHVHYSERATVVSKIQPLGDEVQGLGLCCECCLLNVASQLQTTDGMGWDGIGGQ